MKDIRCGRCGSREGLHICGPLSPEFEDMLTDEEWLVYRMSNGDPE